MATRRVSLALALLGVAVLTVGTGEFTSADTDRGLRVVVTGDDALLEIDHGSRSLSNGVHRRVRLLSLRNQFGDGSLSVSVVRVVGSGDPRPPRVKTSRSSRKTGERRR
ncbi:hypothetical protein [Halorussus caseinilyticus]|uniref:Uncharacterized protein n=1 Tax=Halorussus caseinilyticus TaxID=3034025 RepID=A0ABD5WTE9_9EURY|nr:hypothetical protein [Halorussus sp. DT72]